MSQHWYRPLSPLRYYCVIVVVVAVVCREYADLSAGEKLYLWSIERIYSMDKMKKLKQEQYKKLLDMEAKKGELDLGCPYIFSTPAYNHSKINLTFVRIKMETDWIAWWFRENQSERICKSVQTSVCPFVCTSVCLSDSTFRGLCQFQRKCLVFNILVLC